DVAPLLDRHGGGRGGARGARRGRRRPAPGLAGGRGAPGPSRADEAGAAPAFPGDVRTIRRDPRPRAARRPVPHAARRPPRRRRPRLQRARGPLPGETAEDAQKRFAEQDKYVESLERELKRRQDVFLLASAGEPPLKRASRALGIGQPPQRRLGLAEKALE